jgi:hypothetical protein
VITNVVFNNTSDINKNKNLITELKAAVNANNLHEALTLNENITNKNLVVDIAFLDRNYVGNMKLKKGHILTADKYKEKWVESKENNNAILFLFVKEYEKNEYEFRELAVSKQLREQHLFDKVVEFINEHLSGNYNTIVANGSKYLARAITPVWTSEKQTAAENLIQEPRYEAHAINYFHGNFDFSYSDFAPINTSTNLTKAWFIYKQNNKTDTLKPTVAIYANPDKLKNSYTIYQEDILTFSFLGHTISIKGEKIFLIETTQRYISLIQAMQTNNKYSSSKKVSEWDWTYNNGNFVLNSTGDLRDYQANDKFEFINVILNAREAPLMEGKQMPAIHPSYSNTWCNVYASDLARDILFPNSFTNGNNYAPWGKHNSAARLHDVIKDNINGQFKSVTFDEAWKYTNSGYVVFLTAYNWRYYKNNANPYSYSGHIATCYQTDYSTYEGAKLIQAGGDGTEGIVGFVTNVWTKENYTVTNDASSNVKANVYLGYIIK